MASDRPLSADFDLREFPGWQDATEAQAAAARRVAVRFLQPIRDRWGRIVVTSWIRPTGSGAHLDPETVDFVPLDADIDAVHQWATTHLIGRYGELLRELPSAGEVTGHIHRTRPGIGGDGESLREGPPGHWTRVPAFDMDPIVAVVGDRRWLWWLALGALAWRASQ